jgi:hypothetical protein
LLYFAQFQSRWFLFSSSNCGVSTGWNMRNKSRSATVVDFHQYHHQHADHFLSRSACNVGYKSSEKWKQNRSSNCNERVKLMTIIDFEIKFHFIASPHSCMKRENTRRKKELCITIIKLKRTKMFFMCLSHSMHFCCSVPLSFRQTHVVAVQERVFAVTCKHKNIKTN